MISKKNIIVIFLTLFITATGLHFIQKRLMVFGNNDKNTLLSYKIDGSKYLASCTENNINLYLLNGKRFSQHALKNERILSSTIADLNRDGKDEIILLTSKESVQYGDDLLILSFDDYNEKMDNIIFKELYRNHCKDLNPWKVQTSDVDGDGKIEISIGVYKTSPLHPVMAKRPFIYDWINGGIFPKWRGSRLSRPFDDYVFLDLNLDGKDEIVSIEHTAEDKRVITSYSWKGFGFEKTGESPVFTDISLINVELENGEKTDIIRARVKEGTKWMEKFFYYIAGEILTK